MKTTYVMAGTLMLALGAGSLAMAHGGPGRGGERGAALFDAMDADGDGKITPAELDTFKAARFEEADADGNGALDAEELAAQAEKTQNTRREARVARMLERLDANEDGQLSAEELDARGPRDLIEMADKDGDGAVTLEEMREARMGMRGKGMRGGHGWFKRGDN